MKKSQSSKSLIHRIHLSESMKQKASGSAKSSSNRQTAAVNLPVTNSSCLVVRPRNLSESHQATKEPTSSTNVLMGMGDIVAPAPAADDGDGGGHARETFLSPNKGIASHTLVDGTQSTATTVDEVGNRRKSKKRTIHDTSPGLLSQNTCSSSRDDTKLDESHHPTEIKLSSITGVMPIMAALSASRNTNKVDTGGSADFFEDDVDHIFDSSSAVPNVSQTILGMPPGINNRDNRYSDDGGSGSHGDVDNDDDYSSYYHESDEASNSTNDIGDNRNVDGDLDDEEEEVSVDVEVVCLPVDPVIMEDEEETMVVGSNSSTQHSSSSSAGNITTGVGESSNGVAGFFYNPYDETEYDPLVLMDSAQLEMSLLAREQAEPASNSIVGANSSISPSLLGSASTTPAGIINNIGDADSAHAQFIRNSMCDTSSMKHRVVRAINDFNQLFSDWKSSTIRKKKRGHNELQTFSQDEQDNLSSLNQIFIRYNLSKKCEYAILKWMLRKLPRNCIKLPSLSRKNDILDKFQRPKLNRRFAVTVCRGGCLAFIDKHLNANKCAICNLPRLKQCRNKSCLNLINNNNNTCSHPRSPFKELYYYSIILRIVYDIHTMKLPELICDAALNQSDSLGDSYVHDILTSPVAKKAQQEMLNKQLAHENSLLSHQKEQMIYVKMLLCIGEDAIQIWSGKTGRYNLLTFSYVNIPPHKRGKACFSTFLAMTMNMASDCGCEQTIFSQYFMAEVDLLGNGFMCNIIGKDGISRSYCIFAQIIQYLYDTKAYEKRLHLQCSSSKQCSPCGMPGVYNRSSRSVEYSFHRMLLEENHPLRFISYPSRRRSVAYDPDDCGDITCWKARFPFSLIQDTLHYKHQEKVTREFTLMTTSEYIEKGKLAQQGSTKEERVVNGVYGISSLCLQPNFDLSTHCSFDKAHCLSGVVKCFLYCLAGLRGNVTKSIIVDSLKKGFYGGQILTEKSCPPWRIRKSHRTLIETYAQCIHYPSSLRSKYRCDHFLTKTKNMHIDDVLKFCMVVLPYCLSKYEQMPTAYKIMYYTLSEYITESLVTIVDTRKMDELYNNIVEFLSFSQGMLPPSEATFLKHEWIHVPHNMSHMGPFLSNNALSLERFMGIFKRWVPRGGRNYSLTMSNIYLRFENSHDEAQLLRAEGIELIDEDEEDDVVDHGSNEGSSNSFQRTNTVKYLYPSQIDSDSAVVFENDHVFNLRTETYFHLIESVILYLIDQSLRREIFFNLFENSSIVRSMDGRLNEEALLNMNLILTDSSCFVKLIMLKVNDWW